MSLVYTTLASDTFHRANENPLANPPWSADVPEGISAGQIINNEMCPTSGESIGIYTGISWPNNQFIQCQVDVCSFHTEVGEDFASALIVGRRQNASTGYALEVDGPLGAACHVEFFVINAGVATAFFTGTANVPAGSTIRMEMFGTTISAFINGVLLMSVVDSNIASGNVAIDMFETASDPAPANVQISNFVGGSIMLGSWSPSDSRQAVPGQGPAANTGITDAQSNVIYSAQDPPATGNSQVSDNKSIPVVDSRKTVPGDDRASKPTNSRVSPPFGGAGQP